MLITGTAGDDSLTGSAGNDSIEAGDGNDTIDGGAGDDTILGGAGADSLVGGGGTDFLDGGAGADTMIGDGEFFVDDPSDVVIGTGSVTITVSYTLPDGFTEMYVEGHGVTATGNSGANWIEAYGNNQTLIGGAGDDSYAMVPGATGTTIIENAGEGIDSVSSYLSWTLGPNIENLYQHGVGTTGTGNALDNYLRAGGRNVTLIGGAGNDYYSFFPENNVTLVENPGEGTDTVDSYGSYTLGANLENLRLNGLSFSVFNGTGNELDNVITGNPAVNVLDGRAGNDTLDGGAGNDTMIGGLGDDTYIVDSVGDVVTENANEGTDSVRSSVTYTLGSDIENLTLTGTAAVNGTGNGLDNAITGNASDNTLAGNGGNDTLDGGAGNDTMAGGAGNDTYYVDSDLDVVNESSNAGTDTVYTSHFYFLPGNVETLIMTGSADIWAVGNGIAHSMYGNAGNNSLTAGTGVATLYGGTGDDIYYLNKVSDTAIENPGEGFDTIFTTFSMTAPDNVEAVALTAGTQTLSLTGGAGNTLVFLYGNFGINTLTSGGGQTIMVGQFGDDVAYVNHDNDQVVEAPNQGYDIIYSSISYSLSDYVEEIHLTGTGNLYAVGNAGPSALYGNSGSNSLIAGSGVATMYGGAGDDMYTVNKATDVIVENANEGFDTVFSSVSYTLSANVEALQLTGTGNIAGTGNGMTNFLYGNSGNNTLDGAGGVDVLTGNGGADTFVFTVGGGNDIVTDFSKAQGDKVDLTDFHTTFGALVIAQNAADAVITVAGQTVTLQNVTAATLTSADFLL